MSISPNVPSPEESYRYESTGTPRWIAALFVVLFVVVAALGYVGYSGISRGSSRILPKSRTTTKS